MTERTFHRVLRSIAGCDAKLGDVVETTSWTSALALEHMGYLKRCEEPPRVLHREEVPEFIVLADPPTPSRNVETSRGQKYRKGGMT